MIRNESYEYVIRACTIPNQRVHDSWAAYVEMTSLATSHCHIALSATQDCLEHIKEAVSLLEKARRRIDANKHSIPL